MRTAVGVFDVSHLGKVSVSGPGAATFVNACLSNDLGRIGPGQAQYTLCLDRVSGGAIDDLIAYLHGPDEVFLIPNAANTAEVCRRLAAAAPPGVTVTDRHEDYAVLAVQGPRSADLLSGLGLPAEHEYMSFATADFGGVALTVCRTGYTGEHGYELVVPWDAAADLWDAVFDAGAPLGARAAGWAPGTRCAPRWATRCTGRTCRRGSRRCRRGSAGRSAGRSRFWGREALLAEKAAGPRRLLWGIVALDRNIPRPHMVVLRGDVPVGEVTSGTFSPTRKVGIGLALIDHATGLHEDDEIVVDVRGRRVPMRIVKPPFVQPSVR